ncbi:hypothetical protein ILUMI_22416 [Ignelater luminosus]|uniref:Single domain-containing protein n=1 Tax=Ignelater luminosus TaxID=2038154 RepID=A0A8K0G0K0_IGNLU|nr:hypothetical protein ILUMI_22416 [Ignelater luminosus]
MTLLVPMFLLLLLIYTFLVVQTQKEGGLTKQQWDTKCSNYFKRYPLETEKEFQMNGYCARFVCVRIGRDGISLTIDECPISMNNGMKCVPMHMRGLLFPKCCRLRCYDE